MKIDKTEKVDREERKEMKHWMEGGRRSKTLQEHARSFLSAFRGCSIK